MDVIVVSGGIFFSLSFKVKAPKGRETLFHPDDEGKLGDRAIDFASLPRIPDSAFLLTIPGGCFRISRSGEDS